METSSIFIAWRIAGTTDLRFQACGLDARQGRRAPKISIRSQRIRKLRRSFGRRGRKGDYRPRYYSGSVAFFRAEMLTPQLCEPLLAWGRMSAGVDVYRVTGEHLTMMHEPDVSMLAEQLDRCLTGTPKRAERPSNSGHATQGSGHRRVVNCRGPQVAND